MSDVRNNEEKQRFELDVDGHIAAAYYRREPGVVTFTHTEVPDALRGKGAGSKLAHGALSQVADWKKAAPLKVVAKCPFIAAYIQRHPEFAPLLG